MIDSSASSPFEFHAFQQFLTEKHQGTTVKDILLTHGHPDHVVGLPELLKRWPQASLHLHPLEEENYQTAQEFGLQLGMPMSATERLPAPSHELSDGQVIRVGDSIELTVVHTPGHSPGHVAFVDRRSAAMLPDFSDPLGDDSDTSTDNGDESGSSNNNNGHVLISGDLLFRGSVGRTDLHNASMEDLLASLRRIYESFDDNSIVLSGHTTPTFLSRERESNKNPFVHLALQRPPEWFQECKYYHEWVDFD